MAKVKLNPIFTRLSGRMGNIVFYQINGKLFARRYVVPCNPGTEKQRENRSLFTAAVKAWQSLPGEEKDRYNSIALRRKQSSNGYNLFISQYMTGNINKETETKGPSQLQTASSMGFSSFQKAYIFDASPLLKGYSFSEAGFMADTGS